MSDRSDTLNERIALLRNNIADLTEQAAAVAGAASEDRIAARLSEQQDLLADLLHQQAARGASDSDPTPSG
jgi:uncharacterized small protein (DUF1192 family)